MRFLIVAVGLAIAAGPFAAAPAMAAGQVESACLKADRRAASRELCGCIQKVAKAMFSRSEQKRIAKFFADPHLTQELRQSNRRSDERFWEKYKQFGDAANTYCAPPSS